MLWPRWRQYADPVTTPPNVKRPVSELPKDPAYLQLSYTLESSLGNLDYEDTLEKWRVVAHLGEDFGHDDIPPCATCLTRWAVAKEAGDYVDEEDRCEHRLQVGELELVKVRWGGSQNPFWAMEEESQSLHEMATVIFNEEHDGFVEEFEELTDFGGSDVLVLYKAELAPAWRGFNLGVYLANDAIRRLSGGCGVVMVHPTPIDSSGMTKEAWDRARVRLSETWAQLGFVRYADTPYMVFSTGWADPEQKEYALRQQLVGLSKQWNADRP